MVSQPSASLIAHEKKKFFVAPYPITGDYLLVTDFQVEPVDKKTAKLDKVHMNLILSGLNGWDSLPQKSILASVKIDRCEQLTDEDCEDWENSRTFEALTDLFIPGYFICHISEVKRHKPVPTTIRTIIKDFDGLNEQSNAICKDQI